jgi:hypothetical protein
MVLNEEEDNSSCTILYQIGICVSEGRSPLTTDREPKLAKSMGSSGIGPESLSVLLLLLLLSPGPPQYLKVSRRSMLTATEREPLDHWTTSLRTNCMIIL